MLGDLNVSLTYKVLWVEDDDDFVDSFKIELESFISENGFRPQVERLSRDDLRRVPDYFTYNGYDLILMDYILRTGGYSSVDGEKLIKDIRQLKIFSNVVFYSSDWEAIKK